MEKIKILIIFIVIIKINNTAYCQSEKIISQLVSKNILSYYIKYSSYFNVDKYSNNYLSVENDFAFNSLIPNCGDLNFKISEDSVLKYPNNQYTIYKIDFPVYTYLNIDGVSIQINQIQFPFSSKYLIAFDKKLNNIKFISGAFFKTEIRKDFSLSFENPNSAIEFIYLKMYRFQIEGLKFVKSKSNKMFFSAYSKVFNNKVQIILSKNREDEIKIYSSKILIPSY